MIDKKSIALKSGRNETKDEFRAKEENSKNQELDQGKNLKFESKKQKLVNSEVNKSSYLDAKKTLIFPKKKNPVSVLERIEMIKKEQINAISLKRNNEARYNSSRLKISEHMHSGSPSPDSQKTLENSRRAGRRPTPNFNMPTEIIEPKSEPSNQMPTLKESLLLSMSVKSDKKHKKSNRILEGLKGFVQTNLISPIKKKEQCFDPHTGRRTNSSMMASDQIIFKHIVENTHLLMKKISIKNFSFSIEAIEICLKKARKHLIKQVFFFFKFFQKSSSNHSKKKVDKSVRLNKEDSQKILDSMLTSENIFKNKVSVKNIFPNEEIVIQNSSSFLKKYQANRDKNNLMIAQEFSSHESNSTDRITTNKTSPVMSMMTAHFPYPNQSHANEDLINRNNAFANYFENKEKKFGNNLNTFELMSSERQLTKNPRSNDLDFKEERVFEKEDNVDLSKLFSSIPMTEESKYLAKNEYVNESFDKHFLKKEREEEAVEKADFFQYNRLSFAESREQQIELRLNIDNSDFFHKKYAFAKIFEQNSVKGYFYYNPKDNKENVDISVIEFSPFGENVSFNSTNSDSNIQGFSLFSMIKGSGNPQCGRFVAETYDSDFKEKVKIRGNFFVSIKNLFADLDTKFSDKVKNQPECANSGCSVFSLMIMNNSVIGINLGSSKCLVSRNNFQEITELAEAHTPDKIGELDWILNNGGYISRTTINRRTGSHSQQVVRNYFDLKKYQKKEKSDVELIFGEWLISGKYPISRTIGFPADGSSKFCGSLLNKEPQIIDSDDEGNDFAVIASKINR